MQQKSWLAILAITTALSGCAYVAERTGVFEAEREALKEQQAVLETAQSALNTERDQVTTLQEALKAERNDLDVEQAALEAAQSALNAEQDQVKALQEALDAERNDLQAEKAALEAAQSTLNAERDQVKALQEALDAERRDLKAKLTALEHDSVASKQSASERGAVLETYVDIAHAMYEDSLTAAKALKGAIDRLVAEPSEASLAAARKSWLAARVPYQQTEVYRFGNAIVDDWEAKVNGWPLDEGLIDYVDTAYGTESHENDFYTANLIANPALEIGGRSIDARVIDADLIQSLHVIDRVEANVATGYHVVEFLLWGQDLNGAEAGAGNRPPTDYDSANCTGGNCERRTEYLQTATDLIITDLEEMIGNWVEGGAARSAVTGGKPEGGLTAMLTGLGSLSYGELAGERMKLGLLLNDPEEEHDCFSDNTHNAHYYNIVGIKAVVEGSYRRLDGSKVEGASLLTLLPEGVASDLSTNLEATLSAAEIMKAKADSGEMFYDQMLASGNAEGNAILESVINRLGDQTKSIDSAAKALGLGRVDFERSDSLDNPEAVFK